jgi:hypothetical protein
MFAYEASELITIDAANQYQGVTGLAEGTCDGAASFLASATGAITDTANNGGTLRCTDVGHGLTTGQYIALHGMGDAAHVGVTGVTVIDVDTFDCDDITYNSASDTGNWSRGSSMTVVSGAGGTYMLTFSASVTSAGTLKNYKFELVKNTTSLDEFAAESKVAVGGDLEPITCGGAVHLTAGDVIWLQVMGTTDASNLTIEHANVHMVRV